MGSRELDGVVEEKDLKVTENKICGHNSVSHRLSPTKCQMLEEKKKTKLKPHHCIPSLILFFPETVTIDSNL